MSSIYTKEICNNWRSTPLVNPLSNKTIKKDGPTFNKLKKECKIFLSNSTSPQPKRQVMKKTDKNPIYTQDICDKWRSKPLVNPLSNRTIKEDGPIYNKLKKECNTSASRSISLQHKKKVINEDEIKLCKQWLKNKSINPKSNKAITSTGAIYKKYLKLCANISKSRSNTSSTSSIKPPSGNINNSSSSSSTRNTSSSLSINDFIKPPSGNRNSLAASIIPQPSSGSRNISSISSIKPPSGNRNSSAASNTDFMTPSLGNSESPLISTESSTNRLHRSTPFSKSSTITSSASSYNIITRFMEKRINNYKILDKYIKKINNKYENNCIKKYTNKAGKKLLRIGNKIILEEQVGEKGSFGIVYKSYYRVNKKDDYKENIKFAVKVCEVNEENTTEINVSNKLLNFINYYHFPILYGYLKCNIDDINDVYESSESTGASIYISRSKFNSKDNSLLKKNNLYFLIYELANGTLNNYLLKLVDKYLNKFISFDLIFNAYIQLFISLYYFHKHTDMVHNDIKFNNFLYHKIKSGGTYIYYIADNTYVVQNIGYIWVINDFGLATINSNSNKMHFLIRDYKNIVDEMKRYNNYYLGIKIQTLIDDLDDALIYRSNDDINDLILRILNCFIGKTSQIIINNE